MSDALTLLVVRARLHLDDRTNEPDRSPGG